MRKHFLAFPLVALSVLFTAQSYSAPDDKKPGENVILVSVKELKNYLNYDESPELSKFCHIKVKTTESDGSKPRPYEDLFACYIKSLTRTDVITCRRESKIEESEKPFKIVVEFDDKEPKDFEIDAAAAAIPHLLLEFKLYAGEGGSFMGPVYVPANCFSEFKKALGTHDFNEADSKVAQMSVEPLMLYTIPDGENAHLDYSPAVKK